ncbi:unnamed protein product [Symbiodinium sp. CCMP2592]|nr:unnamed protein product [Symbiodinium sp. CCMP2592]
MKAGIFELSKCRASDLREALPRFNRADTKKSMEREVLHKVGTTARLQLQLQGVDEADGVLASIQTAKNTLEASYKDLKALDETVDEKEWQDKIKAVANAYLVYVSKEDFAVGVARVHASKDKRLHPEAKKQPRKRDSPKIRVLKRRLAAKLASKAHDAERPADLRVPGQFGLPYRLQGLAGAALARTAVASLKKKNADCNYISELCNAAEHESGNQMSWVTKMLGGRSTEKRFHQFFSRLSSTLQAAGIGYTGGPGQKQKNVLVINMSFPFSHSGDTLKTRLCIACLTGQTVLTRAMQVNNRIGVSHECTLDVLLRRIKQDLDSLTFDYAGIRCRKLCFYGLAGDQKWLQQVLRLPAP